MHHNAAAPAAANNTLLWLSSERQSLIRQIISARLPQWPTGPHKFQVESWARTLDGQSQLLVVPTGGGKTAVFYGILLILEHLKKSPIHELGPFKFPNNPVIMIVTPLNELGNMHAAEMTAMGLKAVAINSKMITTALDENRDLLDEVRRCEWNISLWSPEKLASQGADAVLRDETFRKNVVLYGVDEAHVVNAWGKSFRMAYRQTGLVHRRLPNHVPLVALSATIVPGTEQNAICESLGLRRGHFHFTRLSCERPNIHIVVHELMHSLVGDRFPDIAWVLDDGKKVVVYCKTIELVFRVVLYLWSQCPPGPERMKIVWIWYSL
ncbi:P-loop containing nucleoside triphosphate hydrolase protein, partial [Melanogaster broomeanus]